MPLFASALIHRGGRHEAVTGTLARTEIERAGVICLRVKCIYPVVGGRIVHVLGNRSSLPFSADALINGSTKLMADSVSTSFGTR
jgi:hypothetical protein